MSKKVLFVDRDGTIIVEPPDTYQVDSLEQFEFIPGAISGLKSLAGIGYDLVLATNQDGMGTPSYPEETFILVNGKMLKTLSGEGVEFNEMLIDRTMPEDNAPTRKPGIGMFGKYLTGDYDLASSYVVGDRITDIELAYNLGIKGILIGDKVLNKAKILQSGLSESCVLIAENWNELVEYLRREERMATVIRNTRETQITVNIDLDGKSESSINTGLKFFDHMLEQIVYHGGVSLQIDVKGDLKVDEHHTIEDVGIALGEAIYKALGSKRGIERYGFALPMDECCALVLIDLGGRIDFEWDVEFTREYVGDVPTEMFKHFFKSLCYSMYCNLHVSAKGENNHHLAEAIFKAFARSLKMAFRRDIFNNDLPSSKGIL
ncbi:MAG: bifunctional histidinol-phosphatase/imidazoleglycerol-phosphate dehydratase HisB [Bacteroidales bacterium]|nr:bifunctional histidinol-phosphatase/imidazoleglycerol-phosphate dehydratase HisB [Bacteroidales bacterium]